jgi:hypothetical protein
LTPGSASSQFERELLAAFEITERTLLLGLSGMRRRIWRMRIHSAQLFTAAIRAREDRSERERSLIVRSLLAWPSPMFMPKRYKLAILAALKMLGA